MGNIVVRKSVPSEIVRVKELFETIFVKTVFDHRPVFEEATGGEEIYVALMDDKIAGFASIWEPDHFIHYLCVSTAGCSDIIAPGPRPLRCGAGGALGCNFAKRD